MFSVIIPLYNKEKYIKRAIKSVLNQTYQDFEIIVVNDGSSDSSIEKIKEIIDSKIKIFNQENQGVSAARNRGIKESKFNYIAFLDADDEWEEDYLQTIVNLIKKCPECKIYATNYKIVDSNGNIRYPRINGLSKDFKEGIIDCEKYFEIASKSDPILWTSAICVEKNAINEIGGFPLGVKSGEDLLTWANLAVYYKIAYSFKALSIYHNYIKNYEPGRATDSIDFIGNELKKLLYKDKKHKNALKKYIGLWHKMRASTFLRHGQRILALKETIISLYYNPWNAKTYFYLPLTIMPQDIIRKAFAQ